MNNNVTDTSCAAESQKSRLTVLDKDIDLAIADQHFLIKMARELGDEPERQAALLRAIDLFNDLICKLRQEAEGEDHD